MKRTVILSFVAVCTIGSAHGLVWDTIIDTGFEDYALGGLNGQFGWVGSQGGSGTAPTVISSADGPTQGNQAVLLEVTNTQGDASEMDRTFSDLIAQGYKHLFVSYDIYRVVDGPDQNLWWWLPDAGEPTYGLQWDIGGTAPHGWNTGAGSATTIFGQYATVAMEWDLETNLAYSWYDGAVVDNGIPVKDIATITGWTIYFAHEASTNDVGDKAYIDNFKIMAAKPVPEPATMVAVGAGLLLALKRRRK